MAERLENATSSAFMNPSGKVPGKCSGEGLGPSCAAFLSPPLVNPQPSLPADPSYLVRKATMLPVRAMQAALRNGTSDTFCGRFVTNAGAWAPPSLGPTAPQGCCWISSTWNRPDCAKKKRTQNVTSAQLGGPCTPGRNVIFVAHSG